MNCDESIEVPGLRVLQRLGEGYFGVTFLVQDEMGSVQVFKRVRCAQMVSYLRREYDLLQYLAAHPSLASYLPTPRLWMEKPAGFLMEYVQGEWLKDRPPCREDIVHIAEFMASVHQVNLSTLRRRLSLGMPRLPYHQHLLEDFWEARRLLLYVSECRHREDVAQVIRDMIAHLPALERYVQTMGPLFDRCSLALIHGDVSPYNVCDTGWGIKVVDWGQCQIEACCVDIARTFRWFLLELEEEEIFWKAYGMHDPSSVEQTTVYGPVHAFHSLIYVMNRLRLAPDPEIQTEDARTYLLELFGTSRRYWDRKKAWLERQ